MQVSVCSRPAPVARARAALTGLVCLAGLLISASPVDARDPPARRATQAPPMVKYVSESAHFVLYAPKGWTVREASSSLSWSVSVTDPAGTASTILVHGRSPVGDDVRRLSGAFLMDLRSREGARFQEVRVSRSGDHLYARGTFPAGRNQPMEFRSWTAVRGGDFTYVRVQVPNGEYEARKAEMLSPLVNLVAVPGSFGPVEAPPLPMRRYTLPRGAGSFLVPNGWRVVPYGGHYVMAMDSAQRYGFFYGYDEAVTPRSGIRTGTVPVSNYLRPNQAAVFFARHTRLASNIRMEEVNTHSELTRGARALYRGGRADVEDFTYTFTSKGKRYRGLTLGMTGMPTQGMNWGYVALTVTAPVDEFGRMAATFAKMMGSFQLDDRYAAAYVVAGHKRVRQMVARTIQIVGRNRAEISRMMNEAYLERQISQDYVDYQRTRYIRGEADWVGSREGGTVHRTDHWGIENTTTGGRFDGQPVNYYNFDGGPGGYGDMIEIDSREMWERAYRD